MEKRTIGILFGGASSEHDVSLMSATSVLENIDRETLKAVGQTVLEVVYKQ